MAILTLNPKALDQQIAEIQAALDRGSKVIFIEVTNQKVISPFIQNPECYFIDPQHTVAGPGGATLPASHYAKLNSGMSAIKYAVYEQTALQKYAGEGIDSLLVIEKPDMDSIGALTLLIWLGNGFQLNENAYCGAFSEGTLDRIEDIHDVDCWVMPNEWDPTHIQEFTIKWTNILGAAISDFKQPIENRVGWMLDFLVDGTLPEFYRLQVEKEWQLLQEAKVETLSGIVYVETPARGASGLIYKRAPYGIAYTENFQGKGPKFSVMQFKPGYLDLAAFFAHMNATHPEESGTWGGNVAAGVGGSPVPCGLSPKLVAQELAKFIK